MAWPRGGRKLHKMRGRRRPSRVASRSEAVSFASFGSSRLLGYIFFRLLDGRGAHVMVHGAIVVLIEALLLAILFVGTVVALVDAMREHAAALLMGESRRGQRTEAGEGKRNDKGLMHGNGVCCVNRASFDGGRRRM